MMNRRMFAPVAAGLFASAAALGTARAEEPPRIPGPIQSPRDLQDTAKMLFKAADANNDGQISQQEAVDAGNLIVGGVFFRADADGDGKVTKQEADQAREAMFNQQPLLRFIAQRAQQEAQAQGNQQDLNQVGQQIMANIDTNKDGALDAKELRQAVNTAVQGLFVAADRDGNGQLSPGELNAAVVEAGRAGLQAAFQNADTDKNGTISREEFNQALVNPAGVVFRIVDANNDGQLTREELQSGVRVVISELQKLELPEAEHTLPEHAARAIETAPANPAPGTVPAPAQPQ
ncbi:EF-hand domain-containing protein [Paludisphaera sp.]|uniref:EF-hand domain-containing protein n=1 Tax=Paludisphaera sp. TaxID=2017432 RepID=UPI00301D6CE7